jgi:hypothetical protein
MTSHVYYVVRQRGGWGVEHAGRVESGHRDRDEAIEIARAKAAKAQGAGAESVVRIQHDGGVWGEERSFAPRGAG